TIRPLMEAAGSTPLTAEEVLRSCISRLEAQEKSSADTGTAIRALVAQVSELTQRMQLGQLPTAPTPPPMPPTHPEPSGVAQALEPRLPPPELYSGEPNFCRAFLTRCSMHFSLQPRTFPSEESKVAFALTLLTGKAALWGTAVWENQDPCCASGCSTVRRLTDLKQGERSVSDFSIEFRTLAAECRWNEEAQWDMFLHGLADRIQREIYALDLPADLNGLIDLALRVDARLSRAERRCLPARLPPGEGPPARASGNDAVGPFQDPEPMQVGRARGGGLTAFACTAGRRGISPLAAR
ncbi:hypothetical protein M9458_044589, partial [Cirrhinus mrigala]